MNIPESIRIGSYDYKVQFADENLCIDAKQCKGTIDYNFHQIKIDEKIQDKQ